MAEKREVTDGRESLALCEAVKLRSAQKKKDDAATIFDGLCQFRGG